MKSSLPVGDLLPTSAGFKENLQRGLNAQMLKRAGALAAAIHRMECGQFVSNRSLSRYLSESEYQAYLLLCQQQKRLRDQLKRKPDAVQSYQIDLKRADFNYNQAKVFLEQQEQQKAESFFEQAREQYLRILAILREHIQHHPDLQQWFDRPVMELVLENPTPEQMPRVVTSFSRFKHQDHHLSLIAVSKQDLKLQVARQAQVQLLKQLEVFF